MRPNLEWLKIEFSKFVQRKDVSSVSLYKEDKSPLKGTRFGPGYVAHFRRIAELRMYMWPIVTDRVAWSVGRSVTLMSCIKTAESIEMPFWLRTPVGPGNHVLDGGPDPRGLGPF